jgi:hypothetical protein
MSRQTTNGELWPVVLCPLSCVIELKRASASSACTDMNLGIDSS